MTDILLPLAVAVLVAVAVYVLARRMGYKPPSWLIAVAAVHAVAVALLVAVAVYVLARRLG